MLATKIETIFDHGVTPKELAEIEGETVTRDEYLGTGWTAMDQQTAYIDLWRLFSLRRDTERAEEYLAKANLTDTEKAELKYNDLD